MRPSTPASGAGERGVATRRAFDTLVASLAHYVAHDVAVPGVPGKEDDLHRKEGAAEAETGCFACKFDQPERLPEAPFGQGRNTWTTWAKLAEGVQASQR